MLLQLRHFTRFCTSGTGDYKPTLTKVLQRMHFAIDGSKHTNASANLAFLERDPTDREPRVQFEKDAISFAIRDIQQAKQQANVFLSTHDVVENSDEQQCEISSLRLLLSEADATVQDLQTRFREIGK